MYMYVHSQYTTYVHTPPRLDIEWTVHLQVNSYLGDPYLLITNPDWPTIILTCTMTHYYDSSVPWPTVPWSTVLWSTSMTHLYHDTPYYGLYPDSPVPWPTGPWPISIYNWPAMTCIHKLLITYLIYINRRSARARRREERYTHRERTGLKVYTTLLSRLYINYRVSDCLMNSTL